jgi:uncharacterized SAM-binding protein YcdF (DUF218 family)
VLALTATLLKTLLLPPALQLIMVVIATFLWSRYKFMSRLLMFLAWGSLWVLSLPVVSVNLFSYLERPYLKQSSIVHDDILPQAIVVLGGGRVSNAPEYNGRDQVSHQSLWRLRYGARLAKKYQLPLIVSGGTVYPYEVDSEALLAAELLQEDFGLTDILQEGQSRDTWQNAQNTARLLDSRQLSKVFLVTHAYHMRRAEFSFQQAGVDVIPMATGFFSAANTEWLDAWLPRAKSLMGSRTVMHEFLGLLLYSIKPALQ